MTNRNAYEVHVVGEYARGFKRVGDKLVEVTYDISRVVSYATWALAKAAYHRFLEWPHCEGARLCFFDDDGNRHDVAPDAPELAA